MITTAVLLLAIGTSSIIEFGAGMIVATWLIHRHMAGKTPPLPVTEGQQAWSTPSGLPLRIVPLQVKRHEP